ncbi:MULTISPECIES: hypothetical protein [unclassified Paraburkholderia]|uniref:hypothetical protein n=1 Tax=unclassified Paraburkholderia TaxID=2615204 RepID=UPI002AB06FC7|nr:MULTISPECIES: hypothetical protein [unclassified Paraburkholderia]
MKKIQIVIAAIAASAAVSLQVRADEPAPPMPDHHAPMFAGDMGPVPPFHGPDFDVINDLEQLRRLYSLSGRPGDIVAVYHEVLDKSHNPAVRRFAYDALAREQLKPADPAAAIATIHASLEEDLDRANKPPRAEGGQKPGAPHP